MQDFILPPFQNCYVSNELWKKRVDFQFLDHHIQVLLTYNGTYYTHMYYKYLLNKELTDFLTFFDLLPHQYINTPQRNEVQT